MLTAKENFLETLKPDGKPDRLVNDYEALAAVRSDPVFRYIRGNRIKGKTTQDPWGVTITWPEEQLFAFPTEWNKVCTDVTRWREQVHVPDIAGRCSDPALWKDAREEADRLRAQGKLIMGYMGTGMFEQSHDLMGLSDVCMALLEEPEAMHELLEAICEYRMTYASLLIEHLHPDAIISHDDWGSKTSLFMSPDTWREFFKPLYARFYGFIKSKGVMVIHHGDSYLEPIAEDMVELGIDVWQGTLNTIIFLPFRSSFRAVWSLWAASIPGSTGRNPPRKKSGRRSGAPAKNTDPEDILSPALPMVCLALFSPM